MLAFKAATVLYMLPMVAAFVTLLAAFDGFFPRHHFVMYLRSYALVSVVVVGKFRPRTVPSAF